MKKAILFSLVFVFVFSMASSVVLAKSEKVDVCHLTSNYETSVQFPFFQGPVVANYGHIVNVSVNAADAHYAHGDPAPVFLTSGPGSDWYMNLIPDFDNDSECVFFTAAE